MMDHNQEREKDEHWQICQHNIVNFLINVCNLDFSPEEINHGQITDCIYEDDFIMAFQ